MDRSASVFKRNGIRIALLAAILQACIFILAGCSDPVYYSEQSSLDSRLVNAANEAWVHCYFNDYDNAEDCDGFMAQSNGSITYIVKYNGIWEIAANGTWSTSDNCMTLDWGDEDVETFAYTVSGNTLSIYEDGLEIISTYTRTSGVTIQSGLPPVWGLGK
jgi:hypothetical protein